MVYDMQANLIENHHTGTILGIDKINKSTENVPVVLYSQVNFMILVLLKWLNRVLKMIFKTLNFIWF